MNEPPQTNNIITLDLEKIYLFLDCPRCFYLDMVNHLPRPSEKTPQLDIYIESLLKEEFDIRRVKDITHPLLKTYNINAEPMVPEKLAEFREYLRMGLNCNLPEINLAIKGKLDDLWVTPQDEIVIVDYHNVPIYHEFSFDMNSIIDQSKKIEIYQWLFRQNYYRVTSESYYVYCTSYHDKKAYDAKLEFDVKIIPYTGDDTWIEETVRKIFTIIKNSQPPESKTTCNYCSYRENQEDIKSEKIPIQTPKEISQNQLEKNKTTYQLLIYEKNPTTATFFGQIFKDENITDLSNKKIVNHIISYKLSFVDSWEALFNQSQNSFQHAIIIDLAYTTDFLTQLQRLSKNNDLKNKIFIIDTNHTVTSSNVLSGIELKNIYPYDLFHKFSDHVTRGDEKKQIEDYLHFISRFVCHKLRSKHPNYESQLQDLTNYQGHKKLLLIEDDTYLTSLYRELLNKQGYGVAIAQDGIVGLQMAREYRFDGIMCGINTPWLSGLEVIKLLREMLLNKKTPIWICSGIQQDAVIKEAYQLGVMGYFIKTIDTPEQVVAGINKIMENY